jgi:superfamily II DNA helicase RecQ
MLGLMVVDKAHMIYLWGLVASKKSKTLTIFVRHEDIAAFWPLYGNLCTCLLAINNVPLLLLSATCWPIAADSILSNLKILPSEINMLEGELTRPEIQLVRVPMKFTLKLCNDLLRVFAPHTVISARKTVPTLIYYGNRNGTLQVMKVVNDARQTKLQEYNPFSNYIHRYHSCTEDDNKITYMEDYGLGNFPLFSTTMALGHGQNLTRVQMVIHLGPGDPASIDQMVGRCGRGGRAGLALMFMKPMRKKGKNCVDDFQDLSKQDDNERTDALAVTPVCLRIALNFENKLSLPHDF